MEQYPLHRADVEKFLENADALELSRQARQRLGWLLHAAEHGNIALTCRHFAISRTTLYGVLGRFDPHDPASLENRSRAPKHVPQPETSAATVALIREWRSAEPQLCKEKISERLRTEGIELSASTVGRIINQYGLFFADTPSHRAKRRSAEARRKDIADARRALKDQAKNILRGDGWQTAAAVALAATGASLFADIEPAHALEGSVYQLRSLEAPLGGRLEGAAYTVDGVSTTDYEQLLEGSTYQLTPQAAASSSSTSSTQVSTETSTDVSTGGGRRTIPTLRSSSSLSSSSSSSRFRPSAPSAPTIGTSASSPQATPSPAGSKESRTAASLTTTPKGDAPKAPLAGEQQPALPPASPFPQELRSLHEAAPRTIFAIPSKQTRADEAAGTAILAAMLTCVIGYALLKRTCLFGLLGSFPAVVHLMRKRASLLLLLGTALLLALLWNIAVAGAATVPLTQWYQGHLLTTDDSAVTTPVTIRFSQWKSADFASGDLTATGSINTSAANYVNWSEEHTLTPESDGSFSVELGSVHALPDFSTMSASTLTSLYLQVDAKASGAADSTYDLLDADTDDTAVDRSSLLSLPFARNADLLDQHHAGTGSGAIPFLSSGAALALNGNLTINADSEERDAVLTFGNNLLNETLTFSAANSRFEFSHDVRIGGDLETLGTMSGKSLQVTGTGATPLIYTDVSNGRVGIGTTTPKALLDLIVPSATETGLIIKGAASQTADLQEWRASDGTMVGAITPHGDLTLTGTNSPTGRSIQIFPWNGHDNNSAKISLWSSNLSYSTLLGTSLTFNNNNVGSAGVGLGNGSNLSVIDVSGNLATANAGGLAVGAAGTATPYGTPPANGAIISGNVGIGTASPENKLEVAGSMSGRSLQVTGTGATPLFFADSTTGNVGIGTATPTYPLDIAGSARVRAGNILYVDQIQNPTYPGYSYINTGVASVMNIHASRQLQIDSGNLTAGGAGGGMYLNPYTEGTGSPLVLGGSTTTESTHVVELADNTKLRAAKTLQWTTGVIDSSGNVGIGTTSPENKLEVAGSMSGRSLQVTGTGAAPLIYTDQTTGRVGIGTASPGVPLEIYQAAGATDAEFLRLHTSGGTAGAGMQIKFTEGETPTPTEVGRIYTMDTGPTVRMTLSTYGGGTDTLTLKDGKVGIGTTSPGEKLEVTGGNSLFGGSIDAITGPTSWASNSNNAGLYLSYDTTNLKSRITSIVPGAAFKPLYFQGNEFRWATGAGNITEKMVLDVDGNVGIGTTAPETKLEISGTASGYSFFGQNGLSTSGALVIAPRPGTATGNTLIVDTKGLVYDATNKRVGIGTASPEAPLHVYGTYENNAKTMQIGAATVPAARFYRADDISVIDGPLWLNSNYNQNVLIGYGGGNVGIGTTTSPGTKLDVAGGMSGTALKITGAANLATTTGNVGIGTTAPENKLEVVGSMSGRSLQVTGTGATPLIFADQTTGRVGIGTTAPSTTLEVVGSAKLFGVANPTLTLDYGGPYQPYFKHVVGEDLTAWTLGDQIRGNTIITGYDSPRMQHYTQVNAPLSGPIRLMGNVGVGTEAPETKLEVTGTMSGKSLQVTGTGAAPLIFTDQTTGRVGIGTTAPGYVLDVQHTTEKINSKNGYLTDGADYAEYFDNEEFVPIGSLVGMNVETGKVRRYRSGDEFIGIASDGKGYIGNGNAQVEHDPHYTLVGLLGQLTFRPEQVAIEGRTVSTKDGKSIGLLLQNGKVLLR
ncbi:TPA: hypothetical protein DCL30_04630 [Candidatus Peribacteria bacterium]|nr:MAG: hypothetical protein A2529_04690 [Candidatus Peribacteria bacterium RIFOXYD2_FULL_58_15]HAI98791.1 hypothetical protein [Candidatus Peribacteria bacterium]HAS34088.1 hypothetical protein [Candidatus Peribacteria bacterium]